jgi:hypothetical protein
MGLRERVRIGFGVTVRVEITLFISLSRSCVACCDSDFAIFVAIEFNLGYDVGGGKCME